MLKEYHRLVCDDKVLDDGYVLINAGKSSVFDLIICERPMEVLLVRDENNRIFELPFLQNEETIQSLKNRAAQAVRYDGSSQRLSYRSRSLNDAESLSASGVQGGSVLDLVRLTQIYVSIPASDVHLTPLRQHNSSATVENTKSALMALLLLPPDNQIISYQGRVMRDEELLSSDFNSSVNVVLEIKEYLLATCQKNEYVAIEYLGGDETVHEMKIRLAGKMNLVVHL
jgi:hypothetical protein